MERIRSVFRTRCQGAHNIRPAVELDMKKHIEQLVGVMNIHDGFEKGYVMLIEVLPNRRAQVVDIPRLRQALQ